MTVLGRLCERVQYGARRRIYCGAYQAWESKSLSPCWHTCRNWASWIVGKSPLWWGLRLSIGTVAACGANAASGADVRECEAYCTWGHW